MNIFPILFFYKILAKFSTKSHHLKKITRGNMPQNPLVNAWLRSPRAQIPPFQIFCPPPRNKIRYWPLCLRVVDHGYMIRGRNSLGRPIIMHLEINYLM